MSLVERLRQNVSILSRSDPEWVQFVMDHKPLLISVSRSVTVDPEDMHRFRYRPREWMLHLNFPVEIMWINLWLNDIHTEEHFTGITSFYAITDTNFIDMLRRQYETWKNNNKRQDAALNE